MNLFMKRTLMILLAVVMLASLIIVAYAEETSVSGQGRGRCVGFVDENGDDVCDCFRTGGCIGRRRNLGAGSVDEDGDGFCDTFGIGCFSGRRCGQRIR